MGLFLARISILSGRVMTSSKNYHAHDPSNKFKQGDDVRIIESKPISKLKRWKVIDK